MIHSSRIMEIRGAQGSDECLIKARRLGKETKRRDFTVSPGSTLKYEGKILGRPMRPFFSVPQHNQEIIRSQKGPMMAQNEEGRGKAC